MKPEDQKAYEACYKKWRESIERGEPKSTDDFKYFFQAALAHRDAQPAVEPSGPSTSADRYFYEQGFKHGRRAAAINEQLYTALEGLLAITRDSQGVAGYHLNGVIAKWDEFEEVSAAEAAIAAAEKAKGGAA